jgi:hypothetical protein
MTAAGNHSVRRVLADFKRRVEMFVAQQCLFYVAASKLEYDSLDMNVHRESHLCPHGFGQVCWQPFLSFAHGSRRVWLREAFLSGILRCTRVRTEVAFRKGGYILPPVTAVQSQMGL